MTEMMINQTKLNDCKLLFSGKNSTTNIYKCKVNNEKFILKEAVENNLAFEQEIVMTKAAQKCAGVVRLIESGTTSNDKQGMLLEYVPGINIYKVVDDNQDMTEEHIVSLLLQLFYINFDLVVNSGLSYSEWIDKNILIAKTKKKEVICKIFKNTFKVPTFGYEPVLLNFKEAVLSSYNTDAKKVLWESSTMTFTIKNFTRLLSFIQSICSGFKEKSYLMGNLTQYISRMTLEVTNIIEILYEDNIDIFWNNIGEEITEPKYLDTFVKRAKRNNSDEFMALMACDAFRKLSNIHMSLDKPLTKEQLKIARNLLSKEFSKKTSDNWSEMERDIVGLIFIRAMCFSDFNIVNFSDYPQLSTCFWFETVIRKAKYSTFVD